MKVGLGPLKRQGGAAILIKIGMVCITMMAAKNTIFLTISLKIHNL